MRADPQDERWVSAMVSGPPPARFPEIAASILDGATDPAPAWSVAEATSTLFRLSPLALSRLGARGVEPPIIAATMADFGRHLRRHRRRTGRPGLPNWSWFRVHLAGRLIEAGRLQYEVFHSAGLLEGAAGPWAVRVHIPADSGPLSADAVDESLRLGASTIRRAWPELGITHAICDSWLLDPYLAEQLPDSSIAGFARRFIQYAPPDDDPTEPLYFLWGHRELSALPAGEGLTSLDRLVAGRIRSGGHWQSGHGVLRLPGA